MRSKTANPPPRSMDRWYWIPLLNESELQYIFAMVEMGVHWEKPGSPIQVSLCATGTRLILTLRLRCKYVLVCKASQ